MNTDHLDMTAQQPPTDAVSSSLRYASIARYDKDWHSIPHTHACAELFFILRGSGQFLADVGKFSIHAGDLIFVDPLVQHTESGIEGTMLHYLVLGLGNVELYDSRLTGRYLHLRPGEYSDGIRNCLQDICREIEAKEPNYENACRHLADLLTIHLMRRGEFSGAHSSVDASVSKESAIVRRYIERHFKESITLDLLAQVARMNKYHMSHTFSRDYGISPISYLLSLRIKESQLLLRRTDHSLAQIAQFTGFSSPSYFSQSFRKATGISPAQYRAQSRRNGRAVDSHSEEEPL